VTKPGDSSPVTKPIAAVVRLDTNPVWRSLLHRVPTAERAAQLDRWLRANPGAWVRMYHGTDAALPILKQGLRPAGIARRNSLPSRLRWPSCVRCRQNDRRNPEIDR